MVEITPSDASQDTHFVRGELVPFVSPISGELIDTRAKYEAHCRKHNVIPTEELRGNTPQMDRYAEQRERRELRERLWWGVDKVLRGKPLR